MRDKLYLLSLAFFYLVMVIITLGSLLFDIVVIIPSTSPTTDIDGLVAQLVTACTFFIGIYIMRVGFEKRKPFIEWIMGPLLAALTPMWLWLLAGEFFRWEAIQSLNLPISDVTLALDGNSVGTLFVMLAYGGVCVTFHLLNTRD